MNNIWLKECIRQYFISGLLVGWFIGIFTGALVHHHAGWVLLGSMLLLVIVSLANEFSMDKEYPDWGVDGDGFDESRKEDKEQ